ncbi:hypothetical protein Nepgr_014812 [Nepenthes gracilis]|uniref:Uncharacterized protein n=1 Tax=Nepenthes gracilis TaxID=150966 RepID=A0AAD3SMI7_NEPGR|nr:hypothetical protein Nepgr_014812 [Nepenthes gracilis]
MQLCPNTSAVRPTHTSRWHQQQKVAPCSIGPKFKAASSRTASEHSTIKGGKNRTQNESQQGCIGSCFHFQMLGSTGHQQGSKRHSFFTKNTKSNKEIHIHMETHLRDSPASMHPYHLKEGNQQRRLHEARDQSKKQME